MSATENRRSDCKPKPKLDSRPLISHEQSDSLEDLFKVLANDTRLRLLHALVRNGELTVSNLCEQVEMRPQAVSNQLQRLSDQGIVEPRRDGNSIFYKIVDSCVPALLDLGLCLIEETRRK